nr:HNH endonuclease signature motif containing protein [Candidatus Microthrix sp.]
MLDAIDTDRPPKFDPDDFMCQTPNGHNIDACEAATNSLFAHIRRMIIDTNGVVIDLGRARRFTGSARTAALAGHTCCIWPGCTVPATACDIDHLHEHGKGGATNPKTAPPCVVATTAGSKRVSPSDGYPTAPGTPPAQTAAN